MQKVAVTVQSKLLATGRHWKNHAKDSASPRAMMQTQRTYTNVLALRNLRGTIDSVD